LIGGAVSKNEGSENAGLWVQGDCRCRSPSLQLHTTRYGTSWASDGHMMLSHDLKHRKFCVARGSRVYACKHEVTGEEPVR